MTRNVLTLGALSAALLLAACDDDSAPAAARAPSPAPATVAAEGSWQGKINTPAANSRDMKAVVLKDGAFWMVYSMEGSSTVTGVLRGTGSVEDGVFTVNGASLLSLEDGHRKTTANVVANFVSKSSFSGTITQDPAMALLPSPAEFSSLYQLEYDQQLSLADLVGTYSGIITTKLGPENATVTVDEAGLIEGSNTSGCSLNGAAEQEPSGNVFNVAVRFGSEDACGANKNVEVVGIVSLEVDKVTALAMDVARSNSFIFVGTK